MLFQNKQTQNIQAIDKQADRGENITSLAEIKNSYRLQLKGTETQLHLIDWHFDISS